jgi:hypothetical protein
MNIENINFDIFYKILEKLDTYSFRNLLLSSKNFYQYNDEVNLLLVRKIITNFSILKTIPFKIQDRENNLVLYKFLNKLDVIYSGNIKMVNILIHYIHFKETESLLYLFEYVIDKFYNNIHKEEQYYLSHHILPHVIENCSIKELEVMIKTINIPYETITIYFDKLNQNTPINYEKIDILFNYLCWKYFFGIQNEISQIDSHNILFCRLIEIYEDKNKNLEDNYFVEEIVSNIINKQKIYKFIFNYQMLFNKCIICNSEYYLNFILNNLYIINIDRASKNLNKIFITITAQNIEFLIKNRFFSLLNKIINIHLGSLINLNIYIQKIKECIITFSNLDIIKLKLYLHPHLTDYNKDYLFNINKTIYI